MPWNDTSVLVGIIGIVIGFIGVAVSLHSKSKKILEYKIDSTQLITESMTSIPNLKVTIDNQPVDTLTSTTIRFFNRGNQSIVLSDYASKEPLGITITGHLHSYDVSADNPNSTPDLQPVDDESFYVKFDFLKHKQSFSIKLFHDGTVSVFGELTNGKQREYRDILTSRKWTYVFSSITCITSLIFVLAIAGIPIISDLIPFYAIMLLILIPLFSEIMLYLFRKSK